MSMFLNSQDEVLKRLNKLLTKKVCLLRALRVRRLVGLLKAHLLLGSK